MSANDPIPLEFMSSTSIDGVPDSPLAVEILPSKAPFTVRSPSTIISLNTSDGKYWDPDIFWT